MWFPSHAFAALITENINPRAACFNLTLVFNLALVYHRYGHEGGRGARGRAGTTFLHTKRRGQPAGEVLEAAPTTLRVPSPVSLLPCAVTVPSCLCPSSMQ